MPGRDDFAIIRARFLADPRAHDAARAYLAAGLAVPATALATVVGHVAMLGVWAIRETDDGVLPGDGVAVVAVATLVPLDAAAAVAAALTTAGLLRTETGGTYLVGFREAYRGLIRDRATARARMATARARLRDARSANRSANGSIPPYRSTTTVRTVVSASTPGVAVRGEFRGTEPATSTPEIVAAAKAAMRASLGR